MQGLRTLTIRALSRFNQHSSLIWKMPKVPVTSKRGRRVLATDELIPLSIKKEAEAALNGPLHDLPSSRRRSSRLSATQIKAELLPSIKEEIKELEETVEGVAALKAKKQLDDLPRTKTAKGKASKAKKIAELDETLPVGERNEMAEGLGQETQILTDEVPPKKRKRKAQNKAVKTEEVTLEQNGKLQVNTADTQTKSEEANKKVSKPRKSRAVKDPLTVGRTKDLKAEDIQETAAPKPKKRKTVEKKKGKISTEDEEKSGEENAEEEAKPKKRKKNRRGPAGFALRGENVEDTPATRRARLKASLQKGENEDEAQQPEILEGELAQMCKDLGNDRLGMTAPWKRQGDSIGELKWWTGCHCSTSGGLERAVINAASTGCRAFAMDVRCKMRWESPPLTEETIMAFKDACQKFGYGPEQILPHGSYLINLASPDPEMAKKGYGGFLTELQRCERLGLKMYNFHPGSTTGLCTHEESMDRIAGFINDAHAETKDVTVVLENMSSVGNIVGGKMWHLKYVIDRVKDKSRIGFCIDTCHLFSSGVDLRTEADCEKAFKDIDEIIGLKYLKGMHINDSKTPYDSHRDRHENIGRGSIPMTAFKWIMNNPSFQGLPLIMETPVQEREAPVNYKKSLEHGKIWWKDPNGPYGVGTDRRDIVLLNSLVGKENWS